MTWTVWRRVRSVVVVMTGVVVIVGAVLLLTGSHEQLLWSEYLRRPCKGGIPTGHVEYCENAIAKAAGAAKYNTVFALLVIHWDRCSAWCWGDCRGERD